MDIGDLFFLLPPYGGPADGRKHTREENLSAGIATGVFPLLGFVIVLFAGAWKDGALALFLLPALFTLAAVLLCRWLQTTTAWTVKVAFGCAVACLVANGIAVLLGVFTAFFTMF